MNESLPKYAAVMHPTDGSTIVIVQGQVGYYPVPLGITPEEYNSNRGITLTPGQESAMVAGSMFGWDVPAADPTLWEDKL